MEKLPIIICLGSSCFARGNESNLRLLEDYLSLHGLSDRVSLSGRCCAFQCAAGPNISIGGVVYNHVTSDLLVDLLRRHLPVLGSASASDSASASSASASSASSASASDSGVTPP